MGESSCATGVEDVVFCYLRFPSGRVAHMHLSWLDPHKERRFTVVGSKRMATFDDMALERKVTIYDKGFDQDFRPTASTSRARATSTRPRSRTRSRCGSSAATSWSACARARAALGRRVRAARRAGAGGAPALARRRARSCRPREADVRLTSRPGLMLGDDVSSATSVELGGTWSCTAARESATARGSRTARCSASARARARARPRRARTPRAAAIGAGASSAPARCVRGRADRRARDRRRPGAGARARDVGDESVVGRGAASTTTSRSAPACGSSRTAISRRAR